MGEYAVLIAAFDTVGHNILLSCLPNLVLVVLHRNGLGLMCQTEQNIDDFESSSTPLQYGVPQDSILGPLLVSFLFVSSRFFIFCVDDIKIYMLLKNESF